MAGALSSEVQLTLTAGAAARSYAVAVVRSAAALDDLAADWDDLWSRRAASPALSLDWIRAWWRVYGSAYSDPARGLRVIVIRRGTTLVGVLPLYRRTGRGAGDGWLGFVSTGEQEHEETCPEYLDLLCRDGEQGPCVEALARLLASPRLDWREVSLLDLPADTPLRELRPAFPQPGAFTLSPRGVCPVADLTGGFEAYLKRLSATTRQQLRRLARAARAAGAKFELAQHQDDVGPYFGQLVRLHQGRWTAAGKPGCFAAPRFAAFHRSLALAWIPQGKSVLARLVHGDTPLAVLYGFVAGGKFHFYQSGVCTDAAGPVRYPGLVAHLLLMEQLARRGVTAYDFLQGAASYKDRFATDECPLVKIRLARGGSQGWKDLLATGWRAARHLLNRSGANGR